MNLEKKLITPQLAKVLLEKNTINRRPTISRIAFYADQMLAGNWMADTCEFIKIAEDGTLIDGQNRLMAIIKADKPIELLVATGVPKEAMAFIDTGKSRSAGDVLVMNNIKNGLQISAYIQTKHKALNYSYQEGGGKNTTLSNNQVLEEYYKNPDYWQELHLKCNSLYGSAIKIFTKSQIAYIVFKITMGKFIRTCYHTEYLSNKFGRGYVLHNDIFQFLNRIFFQEPQNNSEKLLINIFIRNLSSNKKLDIDIKYAYVFKAWNALISDKNLKCLKYNKEIESFPEPK